MIIKKPPFRSFLHFKTRNKPIVTCTAPLDSPTSAQLPNEHYTLCLSLVDNLFNRGQLASAQQVVQRIITRSCSIRHAILTVEFATSRGMNLSVDIYAAFVRKLVDLGQHDFANAVYYERIIGTGLDCDSRIVNSMIICFVKLGKLKDASFLIDWLIENGCVPCNAACNVILRELCGKDMFLEAFDCFVKISEVQVQLGMWCYNDLIDGLCCKGYIREAFKVIDIMRERTGFLPTLHNYKSLFYGLCKKGWVAEAELVSGEMEARGFFLDKVMYTTLMYAYVKDQKIKMAIRIFARMHKTGCDPDTFTYTVLIQGIGKMGYFDKMRMLHNKMNESRTLPDAVTFHIMISSYCNVGKVDCARRLLDIMAHCKLVPSVHSYTTLVAALYKGNVIDEVDELYRSMLDHGVLPDHVLFLILRKNASKGSELQLCLLMLQDILKHGCGIEPSPLFGSTTTNPVMNLEQEIELLLERIARRNLSLANVAVSIYIAALCEGGNADSALACFSKMVDAQCLPQPFTCNSLIKCFCQNGQLDSVKSLIDIMQEWRIVPDLATYLILVNEYYQPKDLISAFLVLDQMEDRGIKPNVAIYNSIIHCLSRENRLFEVKTLFERMLMTGVNPDESVYVTMINCYSRNGRALEAYKLFEMMIKNGIRSGLHSYTALISCLVKHNETKGCVYLDRMLRDGFTPNAVFYTSLVYHFLRKGEVNFAFTLADLMDRSRIEFDPVMLIVLLSGICKNIAGAKKKFCKANRVPEGMRERLIQLLHQRTVLPGEGTTSISAISLEAMKFYALNLIEEIKRTRSMPNLYLYNGIIAGFCWAGRIRDADSEFRLMQREGICPNEVTFTILIGAHCRAGDVDGAVKLFNSLNASMYSPDKVACSTLLRGLCRAGWVLNALCLFFSMHKSGFFPNKVSYENLLRLLCSQHLAIPAFKIFEEMLAHNYVPRQYSIKWLLHILHEGERLHEAHRVLDMMASRDKFPP